MFLYNSLSRKKEKFAPLSPKQISLYTCGPTVYNFAHIGNFRTYIFEDILKRTLFLEGYKVSHVMNITDVGHLISDEDEGEDKIEVASKREKKSAGQIAEFYTKAFFDDFKKLNCLMPKLTPKATEHIKEMLELIKVLEEKGFTYKTEDGIYFDTSKFPSYCNLAGEKHIKGLKKGARIKFKTDKKNPTDFALWKFSPAGSKRQMEWQSPWGKGFPGWHLECSAMAMKYLGETIDFHCGGEDHIAVHHTNEIAQSEGATGKPFVKFWLHGKFLVLKGSAKMAKSQENFITVKTLIKKGYSPLAFRYLCLGAHYRTQLEFDWEALDFAQKSLSTLKEITGNLADKTDVVNKKADSFKSLNKHINDFKSALSDDLNTSKALAVLWRVLRSKEVSDAEKLLFASFADKILGLDITKPKKQQSIPPEVAELIRQREQARKNKDFKMSDEIRDKLLKQGILLKDTPIGTKVEIKNEK